MRRDPSSWLTLGPTDAVLSMATRLDTPLLEQVFI